MEEFAAEVLRTDRQDKGLSHLRGLLLDGRRKSMQPMAGRLGIDHQRLHQLITASTRSLDDVRARIARRAVQALAPQARVIDDTGFPKDGSASPGSPASTPGRSARPGTARSG